MATVAAVLGQVVSRDNIGSVGDAVCNHGFGSEILHSDSVALGQWWRDCARCDESYVSLCLSFCLTSNFLSLAISGQLEARDSAVHRRCVRRRRPTRSSAGE